MTKQIGRGFIKTLNTEEGSDIQGWYSVTLASLNDPLEAHPSRSQKSTTEKSSIAFYIIVVQRTPTQIEKNDMTY